MLKKALALTGLLTISTASAAASVSYNGYTHNTNSDIVTGGGLDWLQWDSTLGRSISWFENSTDAEAQGLRDDGWEIASSEQIAGLFGDFAFGGRTDWGYQGNQQEFLYTATDGYVEDHATDPELIFTDMFGITRNLEYDSANPYHITGAYFAGGYLAQVFDDHISNNGGDNNGRALINYYYSGSEVPYRGLALTRASLSPVPIPAAAWLFGSALLGLGAIKRRKA